VASSDSIKIEGVVVGINQGGIFNIDYEVGNVTQKALAVCSGKMKKFMIKLVVGDRVDVEFSPYDLTLGRIVRRIR